MNDFDEWVRHMRLAIHAASLTRQFYDHVAQGKGVPTSEQLVTYNDEAASLADMWEESCVPQ